MENCSSCAVSPDLNEVNWTVLLNHRVAKVCCEQEKLSLKSKTPLPAEVHAVTRGVCVHGIFAGSPVYRNRSVYVAGLIMIQCIAFIIHGAAVFGTVSTLLMFIGAYVLYDLYSGILHIVLDHPGYINLPLIGQPCLEFQWHHHIPDDIYIKPFFEACGDLNAIIFSKLLIVYFMSYARYGDTLPLFGAELNISHEGVMLRQLVASMVWMAYFGQYSHRSAHTVHGRTWLQKWLQKNGVMISFKNHHKHHTPPHDTEHCLIGFFNRFLNMLLKAIPNKGNTIHIWLITWILWTFLDCTLFAMVVSRAFPNPVSIL